MVNLSLHHQPTLEHHVAQAAAWLALSSSGANTVALSYAALELRYAIERLAVHYWASLVVGTPDQSELLDIGSFKKIEARIFDLAGHQLQIDRGYDFSALLCRLAGIEIPPGRPSMPTLRRHWHSCSEVCHIGWALATAHNSVGPSTFDGLSKARVEVEEMVKGYLTLPRINGGALSELQRAYIEGRASDADVEVYVRREGLRAEYTAPGKAEPIPIGQPIEPESENPNASSAGQQ